MKRGWNILWLAMALLCFFGATRMNAPLRDQRKELHISQAEPLENAPPLVAFTTVALGGFRGILADILWVRASDLQEKGKYFELVQLADWITKLEPRYAQVWSYHGWNMAYNVSVLFNAPEDRWRWVRHGIELLRDEGLSYNPGDPDVMWQIGWIFQHKIGMDLDDANKFYKESWAREMIQLFDGATPDYAMLAAAPKTAAEFLALPGAKELVQKIEATGFDPYSVSLLGTNIPPAVGSILDKDPATPRLKLFIRRHGMAEVYKLDPEAMKAVDADFGPLDWRMPQSHAIYWGWRSRQVAKGNDAMKATRMIFQSLAQAFRQGRLFISPTTGQFMPTPNLELVPRVRKAYEDALVAHPNDETVTTAHKNFLREAAEVLYTFHHVKQAQDIFDDLKKRYPDGETARDLDYFVFAKLNEDTKEGLKAATGDEAQRLVESHFYQAIMWQLFGDQDRAAGFDARGAAYYKAFRDSHTDPEWWGRVGIPDPADLRKIARDRAEKDFATLRVGQPNR